MDDVIVEMQTYSVPPPPPPAPSPPVLMLLIVSSLQFLLLLSLYCLLLLLAKAIGPHPLWWVGPQSMVVPGGASINGGWGLNQWWVGPQSMVGTGWGLNQWWVGPQSMVGGASINGGWGLNQWWVGLYFQKRNLIIIIVLISDLQSWNSAGKYVSSHSSLLPGLSTVSPSSVIIMHVARYPLTTMTVANNYIQMQLGFLIWILVLYLQGH